MTNLAQFYEDKVRKMKCYGTQFSIDPDAYDCRLGDRITFGDCRISQEHSPRIGVQAVLLDGSNELGLLVTIQEHNIFMPLMTSFEVWLADCDDDNFDEVRNLHEDNPHFCDMGEWISMKFATINQMLDYLNL